MHSLRPVPSTITSYSSSMAGGGPKNVATESRLKKKRQRQSERAPQSSSGRDWLWRRDLLNKQLGLLNSPVEEKSRREREAASVRDCLWSCQGCRRSFEDDGPPTTTIWHDERGTDGRTERCEGTGKAERNQVSCTWPVHFPC